MAALTPDLPTSVLRSAFRASNGELAWQRTNIAEAVMALRTNGLALLGGEVWIVRNGQIWAGLRLPTGESTIIHWEPEEQQESEAWESFVQRTARYALQAINDLAVEQMVAKDVAEHVYYNLSFVTEDEYQELQTRRAGSM